MQYKFNQEQHIHTLDGQPLIGTSSMSSVLAKGGLTWWASSLAVAKFGWIHPGDKKKGFTPKEDRIKAATDFLETVDSYTPEDWVKLTDEAYKAHASTLKTSAKGGTDMHQLMEDYITHCIKNNEGKPDTTFKTDDTKVNILKSWSLKNVNRFFASEIHCYSKELWLGGIVDCVYEDMEGKFVVLDFKSSKEVYLSQFWQCIAYALELEENGGFTPDGELILTLDKPIDYVSVLPFGMDKPSVQSNFDMVGGKDAVRAMCVLYKKLN